MKWLGLSLLMSLCNCTTTKPAPPLPADTTSVNARQRLTLSDFTPEDATLECREVMDRLAELDSAIAELEVEIQANRVVISGAAPVGNAILFGPVTVTKQDITDTFVVFREKVQRRDVVTKLAITKHCFVRPSAGRSLGSLTMSPGSSPPRQQP